MCSLEYAFTLSYRCEWKQVLWVVNSSWEIQNWESYWRWQFCSRQRVHGQVREDNRLFTDAYISALEFILTWMNRRPLKDSALGTSGFARSQAAWLQPVRLLCPWDSPGKNTGVSSCPSLGDLPDPVIKPASPSLQADSLLSEPPEKPFPIV